METKVKSGHPVLGIVLGILGIIIGLLLTFFAGVIAGGLAILLGILAIALGVSARKKSGKGMGAIVMGVIAVLLAVFMTVNTINTFKAMHDAAEKAKPDSLVAKYCENPYFGAIGIIASIPQDEASLEALMQELEELQALETEAAK